MYSEINTAILNGIATIPVRVETDISTGMPMFDMIGYLSSEVREARERVRTALHNCGVILPPKRITVNLSPADIRKTGAAFDLPIAVSLLCAMGIIPKSSVQNRIFIGELNLKGDVLPVKGVLPIVSDGMKQGVKEYIVPFGNYREAKLVKEAVVFPMQNLEEVISFLKTGQTKMLPPLEVQEHTNAMFDFAEVNGQACLKKACEIAASGMHNLLMIGPPGAGKTMIAERMATILPPLTEEEKLETSKIYSVCGLLASEQGLLEKRPFRSPHHGVTQAGLTGGGVQLRPGELSLAHKGVLFLDEFQEFQRNVLDSLRQPLEEHQIRITKSSGSVLYPADFLLLAAMNPCNCGFYPDRQKCICTDATIRRHYNRITQPLMERLDLCVHASNVIFQDLITEHKNETSSQIRDRVVECHKIQQERYAKENFCYNSRIPASKLETYCSLTKEDKNYMSDVYEKSQMTARTYHKILRVSRTIADMEGHLQITHSDLLQALAFRCNILELGRGGI